MTRIDAWPGTKWNGQGQSRSLPQDWLSRALSRIPLFEGLSKQDLQAVASRVVVRQYVDGVTVVHAGAPGDGMHVVLDGGAVVQPSTGEQLRLGPGESFGELALIDGAPRSATVTCLDQVTVAELPRAAFRRLLQNKPRTALPMVGGLVGLIRELQAPATE